MTDCRSCRTWKGCTHDRSWFGYQEIRWCAYQVEWLISNSDMLRKGQWPAEETGSGPGSRQFKSEGSFVKASVVVAELDARLKSTGVCGKLLVALVESGGTLGTLDRDARDALYYISGWRRKVTSFRAWRNQRDRRVQNEAFLASE